MGMNHRKLFWGSNDEGMNPDFTPGGCQVSSLKEDGRFKAINRQPFQGFSKQKIRYGFLC